MSAIDEMLVAEELHDLEQVAENEGWSVLGLTPTSFVLGLPAKGSVPMWVLCEADGYRRLPPRWRWCDERGGNVGVSKYWPAGGTPYFHAHNGVICAPWNRDAYQSINPAGPHGDWDIGNWLENSYTGQTRTLTAMASRIAIELRLNFVGLVEQR